MKNNWQVCFRRGGQPGQEIPIGKRFRWGEQEICALSAYVCEEGLVLDFVMEVSKEAERKFLEKWTPRIANGVSPREERQLRQENPLNCWHQCRVRINGEAVKNQYSSGRYWIPADIQSELEAGDPKVEADLQHYGLDAETVWVFRRINCDWPGERPAQINSLEATLTAEYTEFTGDSFVASCAGETVTIVHPLTGQPHQLTVTALQKETIPIPESFGEYEMPAEAMVMGFSLTPNLSREEFQLRDTQPQDQARRKDGKPYNGGCVGMMLRLPKDGTHAAASSMRFAAPETVTWEPVFRAKMCDDITVTLL